MFSSANAEQLRAGLPILDFGAASGETDTAPLIERYRAHYGLHFGLHLNDLQTPVQHRLGRFNCDGFDLVGQHFRLPQAQCRGSAFLLHGYFDHTGLFGHLIRHCLQSGFEVIIFDLPGHGLSSGPVASIDSFRRYSAALMECLRLAQAAQLPRPWVGLGQSTGGAVWIDALLDRDMQTQFSLSHYVLLAPLLRPFGWARTRWLFALSRWLLPSTPRRFSANSHDEDFLRFLRESDALQGRRIPRDWVLAMQDYQLRFARAAVHQQTLHLVQGSDDGTVDYPYNLARIVEKFPNSKTYMVEGARHHLVNESLPYREQIFAHVTDALGDGLGVTD